VRKLQQFAIAVGGSAFLAVIVSVVEAANKWW
jgi:hypothetical protein